MLLSKKYTQVYKSVKITVDIDASRYTNVSSSPDETFIILCFRDSPKFACIYIYTRFSRGERYRNSKWKRLEILVRFAITLPFAFPHITSHETDCHGSRMKFQRAACLPRCSSYIAYTSRTWTCYSSEKQCKCVEIEKYPEI